jgi:hypothetical protein
MEHFNDPNYDLRQPGLGYASTCATLVESDCQGHHSITSTGSLGKRSDIDTELFDNTSNSFADQHLLRDPGIDFEYVTFLVYL